MAGLASVRRGSGQRAAIALPCSGRGAVRGVAAGATRTARRARRAAGARRSCADAQRRRDGAAVVRARGRDAARRRQRDGTGPRVHAGWRIPPRRRLRRAHRRRASRSGRSRDAVRVAAARGRAQCRRAATAAGGGRTASGDARLRAAMQQLASPAPLASGVLLEAPARMAPFDSAIELPASARATATGTLIEEGAGALVPIVAVRGVSHCWLRNGVGRIARAKLERRLDGVGLALLRVVWMPRPSLHSCAPRAIRSPAASAMRSSTWHRFMRCRAGRCCVPASSARCLTAPKNARSASSCRPVRTADRCSMPAAVGSASRCQAAAVRIVSCRCRSCRAEIRAGLHDDRPAFSPDRARSGGRGVRARAAQRGAG